MISFQNYQELPSEAEKYTAVVQVLFQIRDKLYESKEIKKPNKTSRITELKRGLRNAKLRGGK